MPIVILNRGDGYRGAARSAREVPLRFVLLGDAQAQLRNMLASGRACLALFAAADALKLGWRSACEPDLVTNLHASPANVRMASSVDCALRVSLEAV